MPKPRQVSVNADALVWLCYNHHNGGADQLGEETEDLLKRSWLRKLTAEDFISFCKEFMERFEGPEEDARENVQSLLEFTANYLSEKKYKIVKDALVLELL